MTNCKYITKNGRCGLKGSYAYRHGCFGEDMCRCREPMANADRIRAMSDEELAVLIAREIVHVPHSGFYVAKSAWLRWLQETVEKEGADNG